MGATLQPAVVGATGYAGFELTRLLLHHPRVRKPLLLHREKGDGPADLTHAYPHLSGNGYGSLPIDIFSWDKLRGCDLLFLCTPHEVSRRLVPEAVDRGLRVVDLSGAWRLKDAAHRSAYGFHDSAPLDDSAVYGIPELHRDRIAGAQIVANAGCYATSIILALAPWMKAGVIDTAHGVICDSKSGVSGAGKQATATTHFVEVAGNLSAYSVFGHRHTGEILEQLGLSAGQLQFTPHLLPIPRGILSTIYVRLEKATPAADLEELLKGFYGHGFVRIFAGGSLPQIKFSVNTNYCDVGFALAPEGDRAVVVSCLDNLLKGAAGQAVQNMNVMFGWDEREGLS